MLVAFSDKFGGAFVFLGTLGCCKHTFCLGEVLNRSTTTKTTTTTTTTTRTTRRTRTATATATATTTTCSFVSCLVVYTYQKSLAESTRGAWLSKEAFQTGAKKFDAGGRINPILLPMVSRALEQVLAWTPDAIASRLAQLTCPVSQRSSCWLVDDLLILRCQSLIFSPNHTADCWL